MEGTYRFYSNNELVGVSKNLITTEGAKAIRRYLAGQVRTFGESIALGVGSTAAAAGDVRLNFEIDRVRVLVRAVDDAAGAILFKATIPQNAQYTIHEIGIWNLVSDPLAGDFGGRVLTTFEGGEGWSNSTVTTANVRTGPDGIVISPAASATVETRSNLVINLDGYSGNDIFSLAFYKPDNNVAGISLVFEDSTTGGAFRSPELNVAALPVGYNIVNFNKGAFVASGTISWANIDRFGLGVRSGATAGTVTLDAIRIEDTDTPRTDYTMVSRSVLTTPLVKRNDSPMDVEYAVRFTVG